ncbi:uncharacterized protein KQ657_002838 [Scheffersomyces spartinae]|uniref:C2 domain-containing protein n=1 Tax=Scheffersomyces spartinae TaxID=45513 RepID=A0A9P7V5L1_9ASCO|nr:uncharacterized protein KQ657_002838 [Scheffersomyces spartinae]KAG7191702.1 hypothetical protein KQ657_002838 [Scheffersomyces spartinae]
MDTSLPSSLFVHLEKRLQDIMYRTSDKDLDDKCRRSLISFYTLLLDPQYKKDVSREQLQFLVMKFISCATKELIKMHEPEPNISSESFRIATKFVDILIDLVDKENVGLVNHLIESKESLVAKSAASSAASAGATSNIASAGAATAGAAPAEYLQPCFRLTDMDQGMISLVEKLFDVDQIKLQMDVISSSLFAQCSTIQMDIQHFKTQLDKGMGAKDFKSVKAYEEWKQRLYENCDYLSTKYSILNGGSKSINPTLPSGEETYMIPSRANARSYFVALIQRYLMVFPPVPGELLLSSQFQKYLHILAKIWLLDYPTISVSIFTGAVRSGIMEFEKSTVQPYFINLDMASEVFKLCDVHLPQGHDDDPDTKWSLQDQKEWVGGLVACYKLTFRGIKECLLQIFNKENKPKFLPYLIFLDDYIKVDPLFSQVADAPFMKSWEEKLSTALSKASTKKYANYMGLLPRDSSLTFGHVADIANNLVRDLAQLEKKFKQPLLGFLDIPYIVAITQMQLFKRDLVGIIKYIQSNHDQGITMVRYDDALDFYKSLQDFKIRFRRYSPNSPVYSSELESSLLQHLKQMAEEAEDKFNGIVDNLISDSQTTNTKDLFFMIRNYLNILLDLNAPMRKMASIYTIVIKSVSHSVLRYSSVIEKNIVKELEDEEKRRAKLLRAEQKKQGVGSSWFDDVKNAVNNFQNGGNKYAKIEAFNFSPEICQGLNEFSGIIKELDKLEEMLELENISTTLKSIDPGSSSRYTSHLFSLRVVRAENLKRISATIHPYVTLKIGLEIIGETRALVGTYDPEWDEEFDVNIPPNKSAVVVVDVWDGHESLGKAKLELSPRTFKEDGIAQEAILDLNNEQSRILMEIAVEKERDDVLFLIGKAHRDILRCQERCIKLIVEKFSRFIHFGFSRDNLKTICGSNGNIEPTDGEILNAMIPLYDYLNVNLEVLKLNLSKNLFFKVMVQTWNVILQSADDLMLPKLVTSKSIRSSLQMGGSSSKWLSTITSVVNSMTKDRKLTLNEIYIVFAWLDGLCIFFYNEGNGPAMVELKSEQYQALLFVRLYYTLTVEELHHRLDELSSAYINVLRLKNNLVPKSTNNTPQHHHQHLSRATSTIIRHQSVSAGAARARARAKATTKRRPPPPVDNNPMGFIADSLTEDIVLRLLLLNDDKDFVARRLEQRELLAHNMQLERLARQAVS